MKPTPEWARRNVQPQGEIGPKPPKNRRAAMNDDTTRREPAADAVEAAAKAMFAHERDATGSAVQWDDLLENYGRNGVAGKAVYRDLARAALAAFEAVAGDDLDAMLDSVNEDALLKLSAKGEAEWTAKVTWRNEKDHWVHSEGTGATRMAAIQDAVRQANASAEGEPE